MLKHIGVIMDGNRRWAKKHKLETMQGHNKGTENFANICDWCLQSRIKFLTVYAFSTENWKRSESEIRHLFALLEKYFREEKARFLKHGIRVKIIGERARFDARVLSIIDDIEDATAGCGNLFVQIALSYGGRDEIVRAVKKFVEGLPVSTAQKSLPVELTEEMFAGYLDTANLPDVDLVIRTGGRENRRLSNFLPWQTVYAELFFSDLMWPEFTREEFDRAVEYFYAAKRKLGK